MSHESKEAAASDAVNAMLRKMIDLQQELLKGQANIAQDVVALREALSDPVSSSRGPSAAFAPASFNAGFTAPVRHPEQSRCSIGAMTFSSVFSDAGFENLKTTHRSSMFPKERRLQSIRRSAMSPKNADEAVQGFSLMKTTSDTSSSIAGNVWPQSIPIRKAYKEVFDEQSSSVDKAHVRFAGEHGQTLSYFSRTSSYQQAVETSLNCVLEPESWQIMAFDLLMLVPFVSDVLVLPFVVAWGVPLGDFLTKLSWCSAAYWLIAAVLNFRTGFYKEGELVMEGPVIARRYLATWFLPDMALIIMDFVALSNEQLPNFLRLLRLVKVLRIIRFIQVVNKLEHMFQGAHASHMRVATTSCKLTILFVLLNHFVGCFMFGWAKDSEENDTGKRWFDYSPWQNSADYDFLEAPTHYQYVSSMLYVVCMLTLAGAHNIPPNTQEGLIAILAIICGLMLSGTVVAVLSAHVVEIAMAQQEKTTLLNTLGTYLKQRKVPPRLARRLRCQVLARIEMQSSLAEEDVPALSMISKKLHKELMRSTRLSQLLSHPLFAFWDEIIDQASDDLCGEVNFKFLSPQDILFENGDEAIAMYYLDQGLLAYKQAKSLQNCLQLPKGPREVHKGTWICEAALWTRWQHVGTMEAVNQSQVLAITPQMILGALQEYPMLTRHTVEYCNAFKDCLDMASPPHSRYPDDLGVPHCHASDLLSSASSIALLNSFNSSTKAIASQELQELRREIEENRCALQINDRQLERIVAVVAVRLARANDEKIWVQVGKWHASKGFQADCKLPGKQRRRGEAAQKVVRKILDDRLKYFKSNSIVLGAAAQEVTLKDSKYGMLTKYLRTEYSATLYAPSKIPGLYEMITAPLEDRKSAAKPTLSKKRTKSTLEVGPLEDMRLEVFLHSTEEATAVAYSWLSVDTYTWFSAEGKEYLQKLLSDLAVSPENVRENFEMARFLQQERDEKDSTCNSSHMLDVLEDAVPSSFFSQRGLAM
eukprot:TRINITY_DN10173_c0_g1_i1.p1 TRINITY_DN10173_c0_g1~~TRINITY_DN10173_c0_g1_i1.p1  ORF type:complete len:1006 (-),score=195.78 TRINITY_DN10173_c0_g1_i1:279-3242(-)